MKKQLIIGLLIAASFPSISYAITIPDATTDQNYNNTGSNTGAATGQSLGTTKSDDVYADPKIVFSPESTLETTLLPATKDFKENVGGTYAGTWTGTTYSLGKDFCTDLATKYQMQEDHINRCRSENWQDLTNNNFKTHCNPAGSSGYMPECTEYNLLANPVPTPTPPKPEEIQFTGPPHRLCVQQLGLANDLNSQELKQCIAENWPNKKDRMCEVLPESQYCKDSYWPTGTNITAPLSELSKAESPYCADLVANNGLARDYFRQCVTENWNDEKLKQMCTENVAISNIRLPACDHIKKLPGSPAPIVTEISGGDIASLKNSVNISGKQNTNDIINKLNTMPRNFDSEADAKEIVTILARLIVDFKSGSIAENNGSLDVNYGSSGNTIQRIMKEIIAKHPQALTWYELPAPAVDTDMARNNAINALKDAKTSYNDKVQLFTATVKSIFGDKSITKNDEEEYQTDKIAIFTYGDRFKNSININFA